MDFNELRDHPFFSGLSWQDLLEKRIPVPWLPELESETDLKHISPEFTTEEISASLGKSLAANNGQNLPFAGFTYVPESNLNAQY
jgi:hypothetical protein